MTLASYQGMKAQAQNLWNLVDHETLHGLNDLFAKVRKDYAETGKVGWEWQALNDSESISFCMDRDAVKVTLSRATRAPQDPNNLETRLYNLGDFDNLSEWVKFGLIDLRSRCDHENSVGTGSSSCCYQSMKCPDCGKGWGIDSSG